jgi:hypothetical protein
MLALVASMHAFLCGNEGVDARDKHGHDDAIFQPNPALTRRVLRRDR